MSAIWRTESGPTSNDSNGCSSGSSAGASVAVTSAIPEWPADSGRAFDDLDLAADLDPLDEEPLLLKGAIALRVDRPGLALDALEEARSRAPENYASYYFLARTLQASDPEEARRNLAAAEELNPDGPELKRLERRLAETSQAEEGPSASPPPSIGR